MKKKIYCDTCGTEFNGYKEYFDMNKHKSCMSLLTKDILIDLWNEYRSATRIAEICGYTPGYVWQRLKKFGIIPKDKWKLWRLKKNINGVLYSQVISVPKKCVLDALGKNELPEVLVYKVYVEEKGSRKIIVELSENLELYVGPNYKTIKKKKKR